MAKDFCGSDDIGVLIPYKKLANLMQSATKIAELENQNKRLEEQLTALRGLYSDLLEKVTELAAEL